MSTNRIDCVATYFLNDSPIRLEVLDQGLPQLKVQGAMGKRGIDRVGMDMIDIGVLIYLIERYLPGKQRMNRVSKIDVRLGIREPTAWTRKAIQALEELLQFMGDTQWNIRFTPDDTLDEQAPVAIEEAIVNRAVLFSGGLDSLCGASLLRNQDDVRLVSYYTRQKTLQRDLAESLGIQPPVQWSWRQRPRSGRGKSFRYRSFLFLCLAAVTIRSYGGANQISQYENGILASSIAPSLSVLTTKHAHYHLHRSCETIFSEVFGEDWSVDNPFSHTTKREAYLLMEAELGKDKARALAEKTETCWNLYAGFKKKEDSQEVRKPNGVPCGFCVPCILRQTAIPQNCWLNLRDDGVRNHPEYGRLFREYYGMLQRIQNASNGSVRDFYASMDTFLQDAVQPQGEYTVTELRHLFERFADEFMLAFELTSERL